jgi:hypothetical protein
MPSPPDPQESRYSSGYVERYTGMMLNVSMVEERVKRSVFLGKKTLFIWALSNLVITQKIL